MLRFSKICAALGNAWSTAASPGSSSCDALPDDKLRPVVRRSPLLPEIPTIRESGYAIDASSWYGVLAPRATPGPIIARLHATLVGTMQAPVMRNRLLDIGFDVNASSPEEFAAHLRSEMATWRKVIGAAGLKR
jgi:tripartite-type tricarboxylate transporter receptor subunit TctC